jgi:AraC-like DNA-binding protein
MSSAPEPAVTKLGSVGALLAARKPANAVGRDDLQPLLSALQQLLALENPDALLRRSVELARDTIGLVRVSIYLADECRDFMLGTWGSDSSGALVDEHRVVCGMSRIDLEAVLAEDEIAQYTVFENCLIVEHRRGGTQVGDRGWIACTPIRFGETVIGLMFNDAGCADARLDEAKQAQAVILCWVLGTALGALRMPGQRPVHRLRIAAVAMLLRDPGVRLPEIARQLRVGARRLANIFESDLGVSLPECRNRLRLDRFAFLVANGGTTRPEAALAAGFRSYEQCQQVARTFRWMAYLKRLTQ